MRRMTKRVLIYSHDTFGLGHLRRCQAIAHSLVGADAETSVLILSGSPIIGSFDYRNRVDFVRVPGVIKLSDGDYTALSLKMGLEETLALRASIIRHTADAFDPDLFIVDKEPLGLRGEVGETLAMLKQRGVPLVLGLRDVMDDPDLLIEEWQRKNAMPALNELYDQIWVYGLAHICDPLAGLDVPSFVRRRMVYTGYLGRHYGAAADAAPYDGPPLPRDGYILVTPGGGGDGAELVDWVLRAYETDAALPYPAVIVYGPFLDADRQAAFRARAARLHNVSTLTFDSRPEALMANALGVLAMGGYNTFCELLALDRRALVVPRKRPRLEQFIRTSRAEELGLVRMLDPDQPKYPQVMATALRHLPQQPRPSEVVVPGLLDGLANVNRLAARLLTRGRVPRLHLAEQAG